MKAYVTHYEFLAERDSAVELTIRLQPHKLTNAEVVLIENSWMDRRELDITFAPDTTHRATSG
jgi:hypothetical protein